LHQALDRIGYVVRLVEHIGRGEAFRLAHPSVNQFVKPLFEADQLVEACSFA
jgi:hypothetical protein